MSTSPSISFTVLGGAGEVGASCFQVCVDGHALLLDCGTHPKKDGYETLPAFDLINKAPDAALISHAHIDHCGAVPYLMKQFPLTRVYSTIPTVRMMDRMLHNSASVMELLAKERGIKGYPLYNHGDVEYAMRSVRGFDLGVNFSLRMPTPVKATFHHAGHVLGSASILLRMPGHTLYYTADICETDQELMGGYRPVGMDTPIDTLVVESTRGATEEHRIAVYSEETRRLGRAIKQVLENGGVVLIPCFALGRTQELLNVLARLQEEERIPQVPIYASGLGRAIYELYDLYADHLRPGANLRPLDQFLRVGNVYDARKVDELIAEPAIIVATSGMMIENTPSAMIAREMVQENRHGIFFVGYLDQETLGYKLLHSEPGDALPFTLRGEPIEIVLDNIERFDFSSHAPRQALKAIVDRIQPKNVIYVHGDEEAIQWMMENTGNSARRYGPGIGETIALEA